MRLGIPFVAAVPFEGQESRWNDQQQGDYQKLLLCASQVVVALQQVVARNVNPLDSAVLSVCSFKAGETYKVSLTVVSLPMLLDREVDFVTAMLTSFALVRENPGTMLGWGLLIATCLFVAMLPGFLGLFLVLPLFGHASWHLYRRAIT